MLTHSDDDGRTWDEPFPVYAVPGWDSLPLGGLAQIGDDLLQLIVGRVRFDASLGGDEPFAGWFMGSSESRDGGASWGEVGPTTSGSGPNGRSSTGRRTRTGCPTGGSPGR